MKNIETLHEDTTKPLPNAYNAIYKRRSVRSYTAQALSKETIHLLLDAAIQAPTAVDEQPWAFVIIEDKDTLRRMSDTAKQTMNDVERSIHVAGRKRIVDFTPPDDFFHSAPALIVIYGKPMGPFVVADCWLAAENLMLAAYTHGLGTCVIGLAVSVLNRPEWKKEFGIADDVTAIAPIIVGTANGIAKPVQRNEPLILLWR
jgi:nitroreductase